MLIFRVGHLGDTVVALPAFWAIRDSFPKAHITLLSNRHVVSGRVSPDHVMPRERLIDDYLNYPSNDGGRHLISMFRLWLTLRRRNFDTLVYLAPRLKLPQDVRRDLQFFRLAGIRTVIGNHGFDPLPRREGNQPLPQLQHEAGHLLHRLSLSGIPVPPAQEGDPELALTGEEFSAAEEWLRANIPNRSQWDRLVGFGPGSKWPSKIWPEDRFLQIGRSLIEERNIFPIIFGGPEDRDIGSRLIAAWGRGANASGALPVRHAAAALSNCKLYVGNDTGTMHLAAAVGTRCVVPMSAQDWPGRWTPCGPGHRVFRRQVSCEGCLLEVCHLEGLRCLTTISTTEIEDACRQVFDEASHTLPQSVENLEQVTL